MSSNPTTVDNKSLLVGEQTIDYDSLASHIASQMHNADIVTLFTDVFYHLEEAEGAVSAFEVVTDLTALALELRRDYLHINDSIGQLNQKGTGDDDESQH